MNHGSDREEFGLQYNSQVNIMGKTFGIDIAFLLVYLGTNIGPWSAEILFRTLQKRRLRTLP
ncbi:MAG: hypothetical protein B6245_15100 [Desulfobacteraceae bacterium 4572_88]|nr:MAG: hypothetical protein B6245_15100 [Desulfobacteraceae bacterium 4572_88]